VKVRSRFSRATRWGFIVTCACAYAQYDKRVHVSIWRACSRAAGVPT